MAGAFARRNLGGCVDGAAADASRATQVDPRNGCLIRTHKHFSGYTVVAL